MNDVRLPPTKKGQGTMFVYRLTTPVPTPHGTSLPSDYHLYREVGCKFAMIIVGTTYSGKLPQLVLIRHSSPATHDECIDMLTEARAHVTHAGVRNALTQVIADSPTFELSSLPSVLARCQDDLSADITEDLGLSEYCRFLADDSIAFFREVAPLSPEQLADSRDAVLAGPLGASLAEELERISLSPRPSSQPKTRTTKRSASSHPAVQPASSRPSSQPASSRPSSQPASSHPAVQPASSHPAHPVLHYLMIASDTPATGIARDVLLSTLAAAGRLPSAQVYHLDLDRFDNVRLDLFHRHTRQRKDLVSQKLWAALEDSTVIVSYGKYDEGANFEIESYHLFCEILKLARAHRDRIQFLWHIPHGRSHIRKQIERVLGAPMVVLTESTPTGAEGLGERLERRASDLGLRLDTPVEEAAAAARNQNLSEDDIFAQWAYPQVISHDLPGYLPLVEEWQRSLTSTDAPTAPLQRLDNLIGLDDAKTMVHTLLESFHIGRLLTAHGIHRDPPTLHCAFLGNPGTGKTEVAELLGEILRDTGILTGGRVISIAAGTDTITTEFLERAVGNVVFIDEAYALSPKAVTALITFMEKHRDDSVVILAGYSGDMRCLLRSNPGFRSRIAQILTFPDYTPDQLLQIFHLMLRRSGFRLSEDADATVRDFFHRAGNGQDKGNGRFVRTYVDDLLTQQHRRLARQYCAFLNTSPALVASSASSDLATPEDDSLNTTAHDGSGIAQHPAPGPTHRSSDAQRDIPTPDILRTITLEDVLSLHESIDQGYSASPTLSGREQLDAMIGLGDIKKQIQRYLDFGVMQSRRRDLNLPTPFSPMHLVFKGNPGTGKTVVARLIARILKEEGVLSRGELIEADKSSLVVPHPGRSAAAVAAMMEQARGSVLFIDEAYFLAAPDSCTREAVTQLIADMENLREEVIVILAGYSDEMDQLMDTNPGFRSRIRSTIVFNDYSADELLRIFESMATSQGFTLTPSTLDAVRAVLTPLVGVRTSGNGRACRNVLDEAKLRQATRLKTLGDPADLTAEDLCLLLPEDVRPSPEEATGSAPRRIGFRMD